MYKLRKSDELVIPSWLIQCLACIIIQLYFNPTRGEEEEDDDDDDNSNNNNNSNNMIFMVAPYIDNIKFFIFPTNAQKLICGHDTENIYMYTGTRNVILAKHRL